MVEITAKVVCQGHQTYGDQTNLTFHPDYQDGRNAEWAAATPALNLTMTVKNEVAEHFEVGKPYTLTFTPTADSE